MSATGAPSRAADVDAALDCLRSGWLTMGPRTAALERAMAEALPAEHVVAVASESAALHLALLAAGVGSGDVVVVPAIGSALARAAVSRVGASAVVVDVAGVDRPVLDVAAVEVAIRGDVRAVVLVHPFGLAADAAALAAACERHGVTLIEDAGDAFGARGADGGVAGLAGTVGVLSLSSPSGLDVGEGGLVVTGDAEVAARVRLLRSHAMTSGTWDRHRGHADRYDVLDVGYNHRLDEPRAALALARLPLLPGDGEQRVRAARRYDQALAGEPVVSLAAGRDVRALSAYPVLLGDAATRDRTERALRAAGVRTGGPVGVPDVDAPRAAELAARVCRLPLSAGMADAEIDSAVAALRSAR
jgi:dTDP-4-amino-4,6-dideoxygalactose transaminase